MDAVAERGRPGGFVWRSGLLLLPARLVDHALYLPADKLPVWLPRKPPCDGLSARFTHLPNCRLAKHVLWQAIHGFWLLIDATNWRAEQANRPEVVNHKVWGPNRIWVGAAAQSLLTPLLATLELRGHEPLEWFSAARCAQTLLLSPP